MHYPDEPYVRKYPRKTLTWHKLGWEGRAVKDAMLGEFDRAGIFDLDGDDAAQCVSLVTEIPIDVVRIGLERLLKTKTFTLKEGRLVWPNYVEAQTCAKSDRVRQAESRARRAEAAAAGDVTPRHEPSHDVTPNLAQPNSTDLSLAAPAAPKSESEAKPESRARPRRRRRRRGEPTGFWQFPKGWQWAPETAAAAAAKGVTLDELRDHVKYWTTHKWAIEVTDLDGELVRSLDGIIERRTPKASSTTVSSNPYAWVAVQEHRAFAKAKGLPLEIAVAAYRATGRPDRLGTLKANDDFMARLRAWAATGEFCPDGPLPSKAPAAARGAA